MISIFISQHSETAIGKALYRSKKFNFKPFSHVDPTGTINEAL